MAEYSMDGVDVVIDPELESFTFGTWELKISHCESRLDSLGRITWKQLM